MSNSDETLPLGGVLVGGRSRRFGSDKAAATVGNRSLTQLVVDALRTVADPVVLLGGDGTLARRFGLPWRPDTPPARGPLSGLATGLEWAGKAGRNGLFLLACDLPTVPPELLGAIARAARQDVDAVVAGTADAHGVQPLCGWYATGALPAVEAALAEGRHSMMGLLDSLRFERVEVTDPPGSLLNVNTPDDLAAVSRRMAAGGRG